jgi:tetratricopeptide (TPR) repeat protein
MKKALGVSAVVLIAAVLLFGSTHTVPEGSIGVRESGGETALLQPGTHFVLPFSGAPAIYPLRFPATRGQTEIRLADADGYSVGFMVSGSLDPSRGGLFHEETAGGEPSAALEAVAAQAVRRVTAGRSPTEVVSGALDAALLEVASSALNRIGVTDVTLEIRFDTPRTAMDMARALLPERGGHLLRDTVTALLAGPDGRQWETHAAMGLIQESGREISEAADSYLDALSVQPSALLPMGRLFEIYMAVGEEARLERLLMAAHEVDPLSAQHMTWLAALLMKQDRTGEALQMASQALANEPENILILNNVGGLHLKNGDFERAVEIFTQAVERAPEDRMSRYNLGIALSAQGNYQDGLQHLLAAEKAGKASVALLRAIASVYGSLGEEEEASDYERRASEAAASRDVGG